MSSFTWKRLLWLATCALFVACASAPAPTPTKKKKKKKRSKDRIALKQKKEAENRDDEEKPDKPSKADKADEDTVIVSDESDDDGGSKKKAKKKKKAADAEEESSSKKDPKDEETEEAAVKKKKKAKDEEEEREEVAAKAKKKKDEAKRKKKEAEEEEARKKEEAARKKEEEELARKEAEEEEARKKQEEEERAAKAKKKKKKSDDEEEVATKSKKKKSDEEVAAKDEEPADEEPVADEEEKPAKKKKPVKVAAKAKKNAEVDMSSDENVIDMEDSESGSNLDSRVDDAPPDRRGVAIAVPGVDDGSDSEVEADATPVGTNPLILNERPLVLPKSKFSAHGGLRVGVLTLPNAMGGTTSTTSTGLALGVNYGASDSAEIGIDYTAGLSPGSAKGPVTLHGAYTAMSGKLDLAIAAALAVDFSGSTDPVTMQTTTRTSFAIDIGAWARYRLTRKVSAFSGLPALPNSTVSLSKNSFALPPLPYQLAIGLNNAGTVALDLPIGIAYQATPKIYAFGLLNFAHIRIANTQNAFLFKDFIPLSLGGFYALDKLDIGVLFSDDLKQGTDYLRFDTVVRYSIK